MNVNRVTLRLMLCYFVVVVSKELNVNVWFSIGFADRLTPMVSFAQMKVDTLLDRL